MTHLRRYLEQTGSLAPEQFDAALRRQQIYGGSLDTVLLELGICDAHTLNELLSQACNLPVAPVELLENGLDRPWDSLPDELVDIGWAVPLIERDGSIVVGLHPDLPDERLGALYRRIRNVQPMVTPECAIEKVTAERTASVVPQRYAVLCASYVSALRRRPSVSDVGFPLIPGLAPSEDSDSRPTPQGPTDSGARPRTGTVEMPPIVDEPHTVPSPQHASPGSSAAVPAYVETDGAEALRADKPPRGRAPSTSSTVRAPPVRFTNRGTMINTAQRLEARFEEAEAHRKMAGARQLLTQAMTRDLAIEALARAAMVITPRVGLFRIKGESLQGMATPRSALPDLTDKVVSLAAQSPARGLLESTTWVGTTESRDLQSALQLELAIPCLMLRIDVAQRPVLVLYADHGGRAFLPTEIDLLEALAETASETFENILRAKRQSAIAGRRSSEEAQRPNPVPNSAEPGHPTAAAEQSTRERDRPTAPPPTDEQSNGGWGPALPAARAAMEPDPRATAPFLPATDGEEVGRSMRRATRVDGSPVGAPEHTSSSMVTQGANPVPPPPLPPPPPMGAEEEGYRRPDTLMGLPPASPAGSPRFIPPSLDSRDNSGIISLASPIDQPSARGRIELDDDDWSHRGDDILEDDRQTAIDEVIDALARGEGDIDDLAAFEDAGLARLGALFPGPLEVLRRDLRALPPPSAHGPYIRIALRLGSRMVPYLLELFPHPDPDVRFYAAFIFQELRDDRCMFPLSRLAFDGSGDVRVISMRVLETYSRHPDFPDAVSNVREELESSNRTRQLYAARAVGTLRDVHAILQLVDLLSSKDRFIQEAALESLCSITGQQHGLKPHRWRSWYGEHGHEHRLEWIISSLKHRDLPVRRWAHDELIRVTGHRIPFSPLGDKRSREVAAQAWGDWWDDVGRHRFGDPGRTESSAGA